MQRRELFVGLVVILFGSILACNLPVEADAPTPTAPSAADEEESIEVVQIATDTPSPEETPAPTPTPEIVHNNIPGEPVYIKTWMGDASSAAFAAEHRAIADSFNVNLLERPFTSEAMEYQAYLDIVQADLSYDPPWIYVIIHLEEQPPADATAMYGIEVDTDLDGRGDYLIFATLPPTTEWTVDGVQVRRDTNNDVGGPRPLASDAPQTGLDGYDDVLFDAGTGLDPDAAWTRRSPTYVEHVEIAFKYALIESASEFIWGAWSDEGVQDASWFDYNDHFSLEEAGSPAIVSSDYPIKELYSVDNTCRWTFSPNPPGPLPGLCIMPATATPVRPTREPDEPNDDSCPPPPPNGCPVFGSTRFEWNPDTCQCEPPQGCQPPAGGCFSLTAVLVWNPDTCRCEVR